MLRTTTTLAFGLVADATVGWADADDTELVINGEVEITTQAAAPAHVEALSEIFSGWRYREAETQARQMDDFDNPAFLAVDAAQIAWDTVEGEAGKSCASCHDDVMKSMKGVRATYPNGTKPAARSAPLQFRSTIAGPRTSWLSPMAIPRTA